jgi:hypothetical protein
VEEVSDEEEYHPKVSNQVSSEVDKEQWKKMLKKE